MKIRLSVAPWLVLAAAICITALTVPAFADDTAAAKDILAKYADSVVTVSMVFKTQMSMEGRAGSNDELKQEVRGTIIDPSGLTVVSLFESSPEDAMSSMGLGGDDSFKMTAETKDVKILLATGQELPAKVVMRDKDLDLAFIRPIQKPANPLPCVDLAAGAKLSVLDPVVILGRLGKVGGRVSSVRFDRIIAVIEKPRTLYVPCSDTSQGALGTPVFAMDGKIAGLLLVRVAPFDRQTYGGGFGSSVGQGWLPVTLPAEDILETAKQVPEHVVEEKKPATPTPSPKPAPAPKPVPAPKPPAGKAKPPVK